MTAPVRTMNVHSYWCEGCDSQYYGEPNEGYAIPRGVFADGDRMIVDSKVMIGEPVKFCGQEDDDVCVLSVEPGENWSWIDCPVFECSTCGKEFTADPEDDSCSDHSYSSEADAEADAAKCCSAATPTPPTPAAEVVGAVTTQAFKAGDIVQITVDNPNNAGFKAGDLMKIDTVQVVSHETDLRYYGNKTTGGPTWFVQARYVKAPEVVDESLDSKFNRKPAPEKKKIELDI